MKLFICFCLFAVAIAAPQVKDEDIYARILGSDFSQDPVSGAFRHGLELSNGVRQEIVGEPESEAGAIIMRGYYYLPTGESTMEKVDWVADSTGFRASSPLIPELPQYVLEQIAFAAVNPESKK